MCFTSQVSIVLSFLGTAANHFKSLGTAANLEWRPVFIVWSFLGRLLGLLFRFSLSSSRTLCEVLSIASALNCTSVGILLSTVRIWVTSLASES